MPDLSNDSGVDWEKSINSILEASNKKEATKVKKLRKMVLLSLQMDDSDKSSKKLFKKAIQAMEENGKVKLDAEGTITLVEKKSSKKKKKRKASSIEDGDEKKSKKKKKEKKRKKSDDDDDASETNDQKIDDEADGSDDDEGNNNEEEVPTKNAPLSKDKNKPCKGNPTGVTRLFIGNLPFSVDESSLNAFLPGEVTHIKWITDKETGKFYGSAFLEMDLSTSAADAVAMAGEKLIGRPIKINFAPAREGDQWPPPKKVVSGGPQVGGGGQAGGTGIKAMSAKPEDCLKLFIGNLSYDIDDEGIIKFFGNVDAEVKAVRWLHHIDSGDFKGCGFVEFWNTEACEKGAALNGKNLLGRPIRIDWTD
jgi:RNA recognition motif-containing protein